MKHFYMVYAYKDKDNIECGYDGECRCDTLKEAKSRAKYMLTKEYAIMGEMINPFQRVQVIKRDTYNNFYQDRKDEVVVDIY